MVNSNSNHGLFSELSSASTGVRHSRAVSASHPLEFDVSRCRTSQFARSFLPAQVQMWNDLTYTVFDTGTQDVFKGAITVGCFFELCFGFPWCRCLCGCAIKQFMNNWFSHAFGPVLLVLIIKCQVFTNRFLNTITLFAIL